MDGRTSLAALETKTSCGRYARWLHDLVRPFLGSKVIEAGAGLGTESELLVADDGGAGERRVLLTDADPAQVDRLRSRFAGAPGVSVRTWALPDRFDRRGFLPDTFVMWNVLEHVRDDVRALAEMRRALEPGGRVVVFSPAGRGLMSALDRRFGHFRRYGRRELSMKARAAGLVPVVERIVNLVGAVGWLVNARFLGRRELPGGQSRLLDALVPLLRLWEDRLPVPWGLSVLFVAESPRLGRTRA